MDDVIVNARIMERHPDLSEEDVLCAWENAVALLPRLSKDHDECVAIGADLKGRLVEMIAARLEDGSWLIYHAFTPPTRKMLVEMRLTRR